MKPRVLAVIAIAFAVALVACSSKPKGELIVIIDTDMAAGAPGIFDQFAIDVNSSTPVVFSEFGQPGLPKRIPGTFSIVDDGNLGGSVHVRLYAGLQGMGPTKVGAPLTLREFVATIPSDRTAALRVRIEWACVGNAYDKGGMDHYVEGRCPEGLTCIAGSCVDWMIDTATLPTYTDREAFGDGRCFDTVGCFAGGTIATLDMAACTIPKPAGAGANLNVAIASSDKLGICDNDVCFVPLDANVPTGWIDRGTTLELPAGYCHPAEGILLGRIRGVVVSTTCAPKTPSTPTCGPWSTITDGGTLDARGPPGLPDATPFDAATRDGGPTDAAE